MTANLSLHNGVEGYWMLSHFVSTMQDQSYWMELPLHDLMEHSKRIFGTEAWDHFPFVLEHATDYRFGKATTRNMNYRDLTTTYLVVECFFPTSRAVEFKFRYNKFLIENSYITNSKSWPDLIHSYVLIDA